MWLIKAWLWKKEQCWQLLNQQQPYDNGYEVFLCNIIQLSSGLLYLRILALLNDNYVLWELVTKTLAFFITE